MSDSFLTDYLQTRQRVDQLERIENGGGAGGGVYLTLTRSANLTLSTAGTIVTWQTEVRNSGFTWSGTDITMPSDGYYAISMTLAKNITSPLIRAFLSLSGTRIITMPNENVNSTVAAYSMMRYFSASDVLSIDLQPSGSVTVVVNAYDTTGESPFLHIVKVA